MPVYRCLICGDSFIGQGCPTNCPFCGAHENYMVPIKDWKDLNEDLELGDVSRENIKTALKIEISNSKFYEVAAEKAKMLGDDEARSIFRALFRVEAEHASTLKKMLKNDIPIINVDEKAKDTVIENFKESLDREERATKFYQAAHDQAIEKRAKQVFGALVEVEADHIALDKQHLSGD